MKTRRAEDVALCVRNGGTGAGRVRYDKVIATLRTVGTAITFRNLAWLLRILPCQAESLAIDLLLSRHVVTVTNGLEGTVELCYVPERDQTKSGRDR